MNKYFKISVSIFIIFLLPLLFSPFISLILPKKLTNRTYYRLIYHVIADKETLDCHTDEAKALKLLQYVSNHEFAQNTPYECKPAESLIYGEAYCDFQARTLNALLGIAGIPCRYAMLLDKDGISPHTLNEVFLDKKWCVFDTLMNIVFRDNSGNMVSLEELSSNPDLIFNNKKLIALKRYNEPEYDERVAWYSRMFPVSAPPRRSTPIIYQSHIFDYIVDLYFKIFKYNFFELYQDLYLKLNKNQAKEKDSALLFMARNYHLCYRYALALKYYEVLLKEYPQSKYTEDIVSFCGILYFDKKNFYKAAEFFNLILDKYPKWESFAYYYLGRTYSLMGNKEASLIAYSNTTTRKLSTEILEDLNKHGFSKH